MTFSQEQIDALKAPLDRRHVKQRSQAGRQLSYIESWQAISEANRIFGFGNWNSVTHVEKLFEPYKDGKERAILNPTKDRIAGLVDGITDVKSDLSHAIACAEDAATVRAAE